MSTSPSSVDAIEKLLDRLARATGEITRASERQAREADRQLKKFLDRSELSTERAMSRINKELRSQISALQHELRVLERHIGELRRRAAGAAGSKKPTAVKKAAKKATKKTPAKRKATKKTTARRPAKSTSRKTVGTKR